MRLPPQPKAPLPGWRAFFLAAALTVLAGCATQGDFGEVHPSLTREDIHDWMSNDAIAGKQTSPSTFELTDDERQLRDLAYPLIEPPYSRQQWYSFLGEHGAIGVEHRGAFDRTAYATNLFGDKYRSPTARYARLIDDIRNDITRLPAFYETAARVLDIDQKRRRSLAYVTNVGQHERENAMRRIRENAAIVSMVNTWVVRRASSYKFALERLVVMTPSQQAVEAERAISQLQASGAQYRRLPPGQYGREPSLASTNF
jgi:hypothetical protein